MHDLPLEEIRAIESKVSIRELYSQYNCFNDNVRNGVLGPNYRQAMREEFAKRYDALMEHRRELRMRPFVAWAENARKRRLEEDDEGEMVVIWQKTGKGGRKKYFVRKSDQDSAAQRADD